MNDDRLPSRTAELVFEGFRFQIAVSYCRDGRIGEVAFNGPRSGTALFNIASDACALITELLQRFVSPETLTEIIDRTPDGGPNSLIGAIVLEVAQGP